MVMGVKDGCPGLSQTWISDSKIDNSNGLGFPFVLFFLFFFLSFSFLFFLCLNLALCVAFMWLDVRSVYPVSSGWNKDIQLHHKQCYDLESILSSFTGEFLLSELLRWCGAPSEDLWGCRAESHAWWSAQSWSGATWQNSKATRTPWREERALRVSHSSLQRQDERKRNRPRLMYFNEMQTCFNGAMESSQSSVVIIYIGHYKLNRKSKRQKEFHPFSERYFSRRVFGRALWLSQGISMAVWAEVPHS